MTQNSFHVARETIFITCAINIYNTKSCKEKGHLNKRLCFARENKSEGIFNYKNNNGGGTRPKTKEFHSSGAWVWRGHVQVSFRTGGNWRLVPWGTHWKGKKTNQKNKNVVFTLKPGEIREPYIAHFPSTRNHVARFIFSAKLSPYIEHLVCLYLTEHCADRFTQ